MRDRRTLVSKVVLLSVAIALAAGCFATAAGERTIELSVGGSRVIDMGFSVKRAEVVTEGVVRAVPTDRPFEILLKGEKEGVTDVRFFSSDGRDAVYKVTVTEDIEEVYQTVLALIENVPGIEIKKLRNRVIISGRFLKPGDARLVAKVVDMYEPQVVMLASLDTGPFNASLAKEIQNRIMAKLGSGNVKVEIINEKLQLSGNVYDEQQRARAEEIAKQYDRPVLNLLDVTEATVEIDVVFAKITSNKAKSIGANLLDGVTLSASGSMSGGKDMDSTYSWSATASADLSAVLKSFAGHGEVEQIAKPHISAKSGKKGVFHSGGSLYVPVAGGDAADLEKVDYGLKLTVTPEIRTAEDVNCDIDVSVSAPMESGGGIINIANHSVQTSLRAKMGETMILSGVISSLGSEGLKGFPVLRRVPVLNYFLSTKTKSDQREEMVILLVPREIKGIQMPGGPTSEETIKILDRVNR